MSGLQFTLATIKAMKTWQRSNRESGFTAIEIIVVVALIAIVTTIATPSLKRFLVSSQIRTAVNDWTVALQMARSEAVRQRTTVTVCPSSNGSTCASTASYDVGWILKVGDASAAGRILQDFHPLTRVTMTTNKTGGSAVSYLANGVPIGNFTGMRITVQENASDPDDTLTRYICIARTGRSRVFSEEQYLSLPSTQCQ